MRVSNKKELEEAIKSNASEILIVGELAKKIRRQKKVNTVSKIAGAAAIAGGILATPFTGGISLGASAVGIGLMAGTALTISTKELAILCGTAIALYGLSKKYNVEFNSDGSVTLKLKEE